MLGMESLHRAIPTRRNLLQLFLGRDQIRALCEVQDVLDGQGQPGTHLLEGCLVRVRFRKQFRLRFVSRTYVRDGQLHMRLQNLPVAVKPSDCSNKNMLDTPEAFLSSGQAELAELQSLLAPDEPCLQLERVAATAWAIKVALHWAGQLETYLAQYGLEVLQHDLRDPARIHEMAGYLDRAPAGPAGAPPAAAAAAGAGNLAPLGAATGALFMDPQAPVVMAAVPPSMAAPAAAASHAIVAVLASAATAPTGMAALAPAASAPKVAALVGADVMTGERQQEQDWRRQQQQQVQSPGQEVAWHPPLPQQEAAQYAVRSWDHGHSRMEVGTPQKLASALQPPWVQEQQQPVEPSSLDVAAEAGRHSFQQAAAGLRAASAVELAPSRPAAARVGEAEQVQHCPPPLPPKQQQPLLPPLPVEPPLPPLPVEPPPQPSLVSTPGGKVSFCVGKNPRLFVKQPHSQGRAGPTPGLEGPVPHSPSAAAQHQHQQQQSKPAVSISEQELEVARQAIAAIQQQQQLRGANERRPQQGQPATPAAAAATAAFAWPGARGTVGNGGGWCGGAPTKYQLPASSYAAQANAVGGPGPAAAPPPSAWQAQGRLAELGLVLREDKQDGAVIDSMEEEGQLPAAPPLRSQLDPEELKAVSMAAAAPAALTAAAVAHGGLPPREGWDVVATGSRGAAGSPAAAAWQRSTGRRNEAGGAGRGDASYCSGDSGESSQRGAEPSAAAAAPDSERQGRRSRRGSKSNSHKRKKRARGRSKSKSASRKRKHKHIRAKRSKSKKLSHKRSRAERSRSRGASDERSRGKRSRSRGRSQKRSRAERSRSQGRSQKRSRAERSRSRGRSPSPSKCASVASLLEVVNNPLQIPGQGVTVPTRFVELLLQALCKCRGRVPLHVGELALEMRLIDRTFVPSRDLPCPLWRACVKLEELGLLGLEGHDGSNMRVMHVLF